MARAATATRGNDVTRMCVPSWVQALVQTNAPAMAKFLARPAINLLSLVIRSGTNRRVGAIRALDARAICALDDPPRTVGRVVLARPRHLVKVVRIVRTPRLVLIDA